jgi:hypothetical protein
MDRDKLKIIIRNLELLVDSLKAEICSDEVADNINYEDVVQHINDYDEIFYDEYINDYPE